MAGNAAAAQAANKKRKEGGTPKKSASKSPGASKQPSKVKRDSVVGNDSKVMKKQGSKLERQPSKKPERASSKLDRSPSKKASKKRSSVTEDSFRVNPSAPSNQWVSAVLSVDELEDEVEAEDKLIEKQEQLKQSVVSLLKNSMMGKLGSSVKPSEGSADNLPQFMQKRQAATSQMMDKNDKAIQRKKASTFLRLQIDLKHKYALNVVQYSIAGLIFFNFVVNAVEKQITSPTPDIATAFLVLELFFTIIFTIELVWNMFAHWCWPFWSSGWNIFDFVVVAISLMSLVLSNLPGISTLRLMRAFRVFRLFKRLESLRKIIKGLENAIPGCMNAFGILVLVTSIYAILGVEFFRGTHPYYFSRFSASFFTLFQVMTGDSWAEAIARPIIDDYPHAALFFITYFLMTTVMLVNVVVAILIEKIFDKGEAGAEDFESDSEIDFEELEQNTAYLASMTNREDVLVHLSACMKEMQVQIPNKERAVVDRNKNAQQRMMLGLPAHTRRKSVFHTFSDEEMEKREEEIKKMESMVWEIPEAPEVQKVDHFKVVLEQLKFENLQPKAHALYNGTIVQVSIASLIALNFIVNAVESQVPDAGPGLVEIFGYFELIFTVIFTIELVVNLYSHWFCEFWQSGWNIFDFIVVAISLMSMVLTGLPGISTLRLMRAFRVFRLFKKLKSLRVILMALEKAIPGCSNAMSILVLIASIYSILGVQFFAGIHSQYFLKFSMAFFSMFQVLTGESWAEAVARPIIDTVDLQMKLPCALFFISYFLICNIMLMNVVIAILLENMTKIQVDDVNEEEEAQDPAAGAATARNSEEVAKSARTHSSGAVGAMSASNLQLERLKYEIDDMWHESMASMKEMSNYIMSVRKKEVLKRVRVKLPGMKVPTLDGKDSGSEQATPDTNSLLKPIPGSAQENSEVDEKTKIENFDGSEFQTSVTKVDEWVGPQDNHSPVLSPLVIVNGTGTKMPLTPKHTDSPMKGNDEHFHRRKKGPSRGASEKELVTPDDLGRSRTQERASALIDELVDEPISQDVVVTNLH